MTKFVENITRLKTSRKMTKFVENITRLKTSNINRNIVYFAFPIFKLIR